MLTKGQTKDQKIPNTAPEYLSLKSLLAKLQIKFNSILCGKIHGPWRCGPVCMVTQSLTMWPLVKISRNTLNYFPFAIFLGTFRAFIISANCHLKNPKKMNILLVEFFVNSIPLHRVTQSINIFLSIFL